jgi:hypothetical protein
MVPVLGRSGGWVEKQDVCIGHDGACPRIARRAEQPFPLPSHLVRLHLMCRKEQGEL